MNQNEQPVDVAPTIPDCPAPSPGPYAAVRYNALKHGILARLVVLPHEDADTFRDLLEEHQPAGMTERHLVEELAAIIWRKRRVLMAEGARINEGLHSAVNNAKQIVPTAAPFQRGLSGETTDITDLVTLTTEDLTEMQLEADLDLARTRKASRILRKGGARAYDKARRALTPESRDWWDGYVQEEEYPANAEGLEQFIRERLDPACWRQVQEVRYTPAIKAQTLGEGISANRLEKLNRYESHLDRKFERTLAMLLKLKDLRGT